MPTMSFKVSGVTPETAGEFDAERHLHGYYTEAERTAAQSVARVFTAAWMPPENPAPFDAPAVAPNEPGSPEIGEIPMLSAAAGVMEYRVNAAGSLEGTEDSDFTIKASVQPLEAGAAAQIADLTQGKAAVRIYTDTALKTADGGEADRIEWFGKTYEVVACEPFQNGILNHFRCVARAFTPIAGGEG